MIEGAALRRTLAAAPGLRRVHFYPGPPRRDEVWVPAQRSGTRVSHRVRDMRGSYSVTTILPRCLLASMCSNALSMSSNAYTLSIGSCSLRDSTAAPDVLADLVEDLADLLDRAGAEGDADIADAARGVQVEVEIGMGAAEPADIDDAALDLRRRQVLVGDRAGDLVDDEIDAFAARRLQHLVDPARIGRVDGEVGAELREPPAPRRIGRGADHELRALELGDLHRHQADAGAGALDQHGLAGLQRADGDDGVVHGRERDGQRGGLLEVHVRVARGTAGRDRPAHIRRTPRRPIPSRGRRP